MSASRSGSGPDDSEASWASETLPMTLRKELLERELTRLGFRKADAGGATRPAAVQQQQQPQADKAHPQADTDSVSHGN